MSKSKGKQFVAAVAPTRGRDRSGPVVILTADGGEPVEDVAKALLALGVQPESCAALVEKTAEATAKRVARRSEVVRAAEKLRKSLVSDDVFIELVKATMRGEAAPWSGHEIQGILVRKARHTARHPDGNGRFAPAPASTPLMPWKHSGAVVPGLAALDGKREPGQTPSPEADAVQRRKKADFDALMLAMSRDADA